MAKPSTPKSSLARLRILLAAGIAPFGANAAFAATSCPDITVDSTAAQALSAGICTVESGRQPRYLLRLGRRTARTFPLFPPPQKN
jgi:hypothetical protein